MVIAKTEDEIRELIRKDYRSVMEDLFSQAFEKEPFDFLCALVRVEGIQDARWDPLEEVLEAFDDYNAVLKSEIKGRNKLPFRLRLLTYCHLMELTPIHNVLINLLNCINGKSFSIVPIRNLLDHFKNLDNPKQSKKENQKFSLNHIPPSAKMKWNAIKRYANHSKQDNFANLIDQIFDDRIRNPFSHGDYCLTEEDFRWTEGGPASSLPLYDVNLKIISAFIFADEFFRLMDGYQGLLSTAPRFHKWSNYEVFEILSEDNKAIGWKVHYSNGSCSHYQRTKTGCVANNFHFSHDGSLEFMIGITNELEPKWKVNGVEVINFDELNAK